MKDSKMEQSRLDVGRRAILEERWMLVDRKQKELEKKVAVVKRLKGMYAQLFEDPSESVCEVDRRTWLNNQRFYYDSYICLHPYKYKFDNCSLYILAKSTDDPLLREIVKRYPPSEVGSFVKMQEERSHISTIIRGLMSRTLTEKEYESALAYFENLNEKKEKIK